MPAKVEVLAPGHLTSPRGAGLGGWRRMAHALAIVAGWVLFFWGWHRVLAATPDFAELRLLMLGATIVVPVVTVSWILHNRGIHRRKGPRRHVAAATLAYRVDFNGHDVVADFRSLANARRVHIFVAGACKHYREDVEAERPVARGAADAREELADRAAAAPDPGARRAATAAADRPPTLDGHNGSRGA